MYLSPWEQVQWVVRFRPEKPKALFADLEKHQLTFLQLPLPLQTTLDDTGKNTAY